MDPELTRLDLAALLQVTPQTVWNWKERGYITARREGVWTYFKLRAVAAAIRKHRLRVKPHIIEAIEHQLSATA